MHSLLFITMNLSLLSIISLTVREETLEKMFFVSKTETLAKLFFLISFTGLIMYVILAFYSFHTAYSTEQTFQHQFERLQNVNVIKLERFNKDLKYILLWTTPNEPFKQMVEGQKPFIMNKCLNINCFVTTKKDMLYGDYRNFDVIILSISVLKKWKTNLPQKRSPRQKYVFYGMQSADDHPICNIQADNFFNWTWSYKLYSDIATPFIEVRDLKGNFKAPIIDSAADWPTDMGRSKNYTFKINTKTKAVAWVIDKCITRTNRMLYAKQLQIALKEHSLLLDIYGCGTKQCPKDGCMRAIQRDYYFYLAYEDSNSDDYVTKEVLKAYDNDAIPIVKGGAEYSKFLPAGSYIDAQDHTVKNLAAIIDYTIRNPTVYNNYHQWKNFYTIKKVDSTTGYCGLCDLLNDKVRFETDSYYEAFRKWWYYAPLNERCFPKGAEKFDDLLSYMNDTL